jgi:hypothetical protein
MQFGVRSDFPEWPSMIRGGAAGRTVGSNAARRTGASPRSLAAEANGCFMVGIQHGSNRIQGCGASVARDGGLPSDLLNVLTEAATI